MADLIYDYGLDEWRDWETATFTWLALKSTHSPDRTDHFIADIVADEITVTGYARATAGTKTRTVDTTQHRVTYDCADPNLGTLAAGQTVGYLVLAKVITNDAQSPLLALFDIAEFATDGAPFQPVIAAAGVHYIDQAA